MRPDSVPDIGAIQIIYLLTYLNNHATTPATIKLQVIIFSSEKVTQRS